MKAGVVTAFCGLLGYALAAVNPGSSPTTFAKRSSGASRSAAASPNGSPHGSPIKGKQDLVRSREVAGVTEDGREGDDLKRRRKNDSIEPPFGAGADFYDLAHSSMQKDDSGNLGSSPSSPFQAEPIESYVPEDPTEPDPFLYYSPTTARNTVQQTHVPVIPVPATPVPLNTPAAPRIPADPFPLKPSRQVQFIPGLFSQHEAHLLMNWSRIDAKVDRPNREYARPFVSDYMQQVVDDYLNDLPHDLVFQS